MANSSNALLKWIVITGGLILIGGFTLVIAVIFEKATTTKKGCVEQSTVFASLEESAHAKALDGNLLLLESQQHIYIVNWCEDRLLRTINKTSE